MAAKKSKPRMHARYERAEKELFSLVVGKKPEFSEIYLVIAPTKAGKSFLMARLAEKINADVARQGKNDASHVPTISQQLSSPVRGGFDYSLMYRQDLKQLLPHARNLLDKELPGAVTHGLIERNTIAMLKDEAHHLLNVSAGAADQDRMVNQLDALKVVVNESKVRLVLFGGAKLAKACMINSHFKSRAHTIIIGAYDGSIKADRKEFHRLVQEAMVQYKVVDYDPTIFDTSVTIMNRVQGLIGWFWESIEKSKRMHKAKLTVANVLAALPSPVGMESVIAEVDAVRELENRTHPMSDDQFLRVKPRTDVAAPAAAKPPASAPKSKGKTQAAQFGKRGNVRDPACGVL